MDGLDNFGFEPSKSCPGKIGECEIDFGMWGIKRGGLVIEII